MIRIPNHPSSQTSCRDVSSEPIRRAWSIQCSHQCRLCLKGFERRFHRSIGALELHPAANTGVAGDHSKLKSNGGTLPHVAPRSGKSPGNQGVCQFPSDKIGINPGAGGVMPHDFGVYPTNGHVLASEGMLGEHLCPFGGNPSLAGNFEDGIGLSPWG